MVPLFCVGIPQSHARIVFILHNFHWICALKSVSSLIRRCLIRAGFDILVSLTKSAASGPKLVWPPDLVGALSSSYGNVKMAMEWYQVAFNQNAADEVKRFFDGSWVASKLFRPTYQVFKIRVLSWSYLWTLNFKLPVIFDRKLVILD